MYQLLLASNMLLEKKNNTNSRVKWQASYLPHFSESKLIEQSKLYYLQNMATPWDSGLIG